MAHATIDEYIDACPDDVRPIMREIRRRVHVIVPGAGETISYGIPAVTLGGKRLMYFAAWKTHISVYPVPAADQDMEREFAPYLASKGTLRFGLDRPVPYELIEQVAEALAAQRGPAGP